MTRPLSFRPHNQFDAARAFAPASSLVILWGETNEMRLASTKSLRSAAAGLLATPMLATGSAASAQDDPQGQPPASGEASGASDQADTGRGQSDDADIVVTAQKREENLQDV